MENYKDIMTDANNIYEAYLQTIKSSKWKPETQRCMLNFLTVISKKKKELSDQTYQTQQGGEFFLNERGKTRAICTKNIEDRIVRHVACDKILTPELKKKLIFENGASIPGKGTDFNKRVFERDLHKFYRDNNSNDGYVLFMDFSKYYDNIIHSKLLKDVMKHFDDDPYLKWLLEDFLNSSNIDVSYMDDKEYSECLYSLFNSIDYRNANYPKLGKKFMEKSLEIGNQDSQIFGVFYPHRIDNYIKYVRSEKYYGRFADDSYIIHKSKEHLQDLLQDIIKIADEYGIHINLKKTRIVKLSSTYKFLQVRYSLTGTCKVIKRINPKAVTRVRQKLKSFAKKLDDGEMDIETIHNWYKSWFSNYKSLMSKKQRKHLDRLYNKLFIKNWRYQYG